MASLELSLPGNEKDIANPDNQTQGLQLSLPTGGTNMPATYRTDLDNIPSYFKQFSPGNLPMETLKKQRAMAQSGWEQAGRAIAGGVSKGVMTAVEDLGYIADFQNNFAHLMQVDDLETNWLSSWAKENKENLSERFQVYTEDPSKTFAWGDSGFYWSFLQEALTSAVGFGAPGLAVMGAARGAVKFANAYTGLLSATSKGNKAIQLLSAYGMNVGEGKFMALETYNTTIEGLKPLVERGEITGEEAEMRANRAADRMFTLNRAMMLTDYLTVGGAMKTLGMGGPKQSVFRQMLKEAPRESLEEMYQGTVDKTVSSLELQDAGAEQRKTLGATIVESALDPSTLLEGLMGAVSGPIQMGVITEPQRAVSNWISDSPASEKETKSEVDIENEVAENVKAHAKSHAKAEAAKAAGLNGLAAVEAEREFLDNTFKALSKNEGYKIKAQLDAERAKLGEDQTQDAEALTRLETLFETAATAFDKHVGSPNQNGLMSAEVSKVYAQMTIEGLDTEINQKTDEILTFLADTGTPVSSIDEALENEETADMVQGLESFDILQSLQTQKKSATKVYKDANASIRELSKASSQKKARSKRKAEAAAQEKAINEVRQRVEEYEKEAAKATKNETVEEEPTDTNPPSQQDVAPRTSADVESLKFDRPAQQDSTPTQQAAPFGQNLEPGKIVYSLEDEDFDLDDILNNIQIDGDKVDDVVEKRQNVDRDIADKRAVVEEGEVKIVTRQPSREIAWKLEKTKVVNGKHVSEPHGLISDYKDNQVTPDLAGQSITFIIEDNDNLPVYAPEWYANVEAGLDADASQMTTWGELKKVLPESDMHNFIPIRIEADGKKLGYVHATEWVRTDDVAWNPAAETEKLSSMRKSIVDKNGATGKVSFVSRGQLNFSGDAVPLIKNFKDSDVVVYAPKESEAGGAVPYFFTKDGKKTPEELGVTLPETMFPGLTYFIADNGKTKELVFAQRRGLSPEVIEGVKNVVRVWWKLGQGFDLIHMKESEQALYNNLKDQGIDLKQESAVKQYLKPMLRNTAMKTTSGNYMPAEIFLQTTRRFRGDAGVMSYEKNFLAGGFGVGKDANSLKTLTEVKQSVFKIHRVTTKSQQLLDAELNKMGAVLGAMWYNTDGDIIGQTTPVPIVKGNEVTVVPNYDNFIKVSHTTHLKPIENEEGDVTYTRQHIMEFEVDGADAVGQNPERGPSLSPVEAYHLRTQQQMLFGPEIKPTSNAVWKAVSEREFTSILDEAQFWLDQDDVGMEQLIDIYEKLRSHSPQEAYWGIETPQARVAETITGLKFNRDSFNQFKKSDDDEFWLVDSGGESADDVLNGLTNGSEISAEIDGTTDITEDTIEDVLDAQLTNGFYNKQVREMSKALRDKYREVFNDFDQQYLPKKYRISPNLTLQTIKRTRRLYGMGGAVKTSETDEVYDATPFSIDEQMELSPHERTRIGLAIANNIIAKVAIENALDKAHINKIVEGIRTQIQEYSEENEGAQIVLDNFDDILSAISWPYVETAGVVNFQYDRTDDEEAEDTKSFDSLNSLEWNAAKTASQGVRKLLASIPKETSIYGIQEYVDLDEAVNTVFSITAGNQDNFEGKIALLAAAKRNKPWLKTFISQVSKADDQLKKQFTIATNNVEQDMYTAMFTVTEAGVAIELFHEGKFQKAQNIVKEWDRNILGVDGIVKKGDSHYFTKEWVTQLDEKYQTLVDRYNELVIKVAVLSKTDKQAADSLFRQEMQYSVADGLVEFYSHMGITLTSEEALEIWLTKNGHQQLVRKTGENSPSMLSSMSTPVKRKRNWITGTYAAVKEAAEQAVLLNQAIQASNPITNQNVSSARLLAISLAEGSRLSTMQVQRVGNKNVPRYGMYNKLTEMAEILKKDEQARIDARKDKRLANNIILDVLDSEKGRVDFTISPHSLNALSQRYSKRNSQDFVNMTSPDQEAVRVIGFFESVAKPSPTKEISAGGNTSRQMYVLTPTISDKAKIMAVKTYTIGNRTTFSPDGKLTDTAAKAIAQRMVVPEIIRAQSDSSHRANIFYSFVGLNEIEALRNPKTGLINTSALVDGKLSEEVESSVLKVIKETIDAQAARTSERWRALDVAQFVPVSDEYSFAQAVLDYEINTTVFNAAYYQIFKGDVSYSYKSSPSKSIKEQIDDTYNNLHKRLAADSAPGLTPAFDNPNELVTYAALDDTKQVSNAIESYRNLLSNEESSQYEEIESADAQELVTLEEYLQLAYDQGRITKEDVEELPKILERAGTDIPKSIIGKLQVFKYVTTGIVQDPTTGERKEVYIKSSIMPLIPYVLGDSQLGKLAAAMKRTGHRHVVYKSGLKLGSPAGIKKAFTVDGTLVDNIDEVLQAGSFTVPRKFLRLQQETPFKDKAMINRGTQETKLVFQGLFGRKDIKYSYGSISGLDVDALFELDRSLLQSMFEDLHRQFLRAYLSETGDILTSPAFLKLLKKEAMDRGYPAADIDNIAIVDGKMRVPVWGADSSSRIFTLMNSLVTNNLLKLKMPGTAGVLGSDLGFTWKGLEEGEKGDKFIKANSSRILFTENYDPEQGLKPQRRVKKDVYEESKEENYKITKQDEKDGNVLVLPAQILLPNVFFTNDNTIKLNLKRFIGEDGKLDMSKFDPKLLRMMGFRIPTQGHSSMSYMEVVGVLPEEHGNLIIAPKDFTKQMGSDFDVDKLYIYRYNIFETLDGVVKRYDDAVSRRDKKATLQNQYLDVRMAILSNPDRQVQTQILSPLGEEKWGTMADQYGSEPALSHNSAAYQQTRVERAAAGSAGIGYFSQILTLQPLLEKAHANGNTIRFFETDEDGQTSVRSHSFAGYEFKAELGIDSTVDSDGSRFKRMVGIQSASVDNENLQILHRVGVTPESFNAVAGAIMTGASTELITLMLLQPAVKQKLAADKLRRSIVIREKSRSEDLPEPAEDAIPITKKNLLSIVQDEEVSQDIYDAAQIEALRAFDFFEQIGNKINTIAKTINVDSKKLPKMPIEAIIKREEVQELFSTSPTLKRALYGYTDANGKFHGASIFGIATHFGLNFVNDYFAKAALVDSPVFKDAVASYVDSTNFFGPDAVERASVKAYNTLRAMSYRIAVPSDTEITELIKNEYDKDTGEITHYSLGEIIQDMKREGLHKFGSPELTYFLSQLNIVQEGTQHPVYIRYENAASDLIFGTQVKYSFEAMLANNSIVGTYNGKEWTMRDIALGLTKYTMGLGQTSNPVSFSKFITPEAKELLGMSRNVYEMVEKQMRRGEANNLLEQMILSDPEAIRTLSSILRQDKFRTEPIFTGKINAKNNVIPVQNVEDAPAYAVGTYRNRYRIFKLVTEQNGKAYYEVTAYDRAVKSTEPFLYSAPLMKDTGAQFKIGGRDLSREVRTFSSEDYVKMNANKQTFTSGERVTTSLIVEAGAALAEANRPAGRVSLQLLEKWSSVMPGTINVEVSPMDKTIRGFYDQTSNTIHINSARSKTDQAETVHHELLHVLNASVVNKDNRNYAELEDVMNRVRSHYGITQEMVDKVMKGLSEKKTLSSRVLSNSEIASLKESIPAELLKAKKGSVAAFIYAVSSVDELVAHTLTDETFMRAADNVEAKAGFSLKQAIVELLSLLRKVLLDLKGEKATALDEIIFYMDQSAQVGAAQVAPNGSGVRFSAEEMAIIARELKRCKS